MTHVVLRWFCTGLLTIPLLCFPCAGQVPVPDSAVSQAVSAVRKNPDGSAQADLFAMDTFMSLKAFGDSAEDAIRAAEEEITRLDGIFSTGNENSEIASINRSGEAAVSEDTMTLVGRSLKLAGETDGLFNIAIYPAMQLWGFPTKEFRVPGRDELQAALSLADTDAVLADRDSMTVRLEREGMAIDLGGIAKGFTSARVMEIFRSYGVESALVSLGGNVQTLGAKPDGSDWRVAIQDPDGGSEYLGVLPVRDKAMITSGGYERYFEENGIRYHHILDPRTGYPAQSGVISSTIVSADGTLADGLSTALYIMGVEEASEFWRNSGEEFDFILETEDGKLHVTEGIAGDLQTNRKVVKVSR